MEQVVYVFEGDNVDVGVLQLCQAIRHFVRCDCTPSVQLGVHAVKSDYGKTRPVYSFDDVLYAVIIPFMREDVTENLSASLPIPTFRNQAVICSSSVQVSILRQGFANRSVLAPVPVRISKRNHAYAKLLLKPSLALSQFNVDSADESKSTFECHQL